MVDSPKPKNTDHWDARVDLAAAFQWTARLNMHEGVANHFSLAISPGNSKFLMNPNQMHFSCIRASDIIIVDSLDRDILKQKHAPDPTAWGLHGGLHTTCAHARCVIIVGLCLGRARHHSDHAVCRYKRVPLDDGRAQRNDAAQPLGP